MAGQQTKFDQYLSEELEKYRGIAVPVRSSLLRRIIVKNVNCHKLHPNPDDEFCKPEVGPSYEIISRYMEDILTARKSHEKRAIKEKVIVEKMRPDGYMLLNGHHRWAAAIRTGEKKIPVRIVNMTYERDIQKMLEKTKHTKRVTLDLDEVVLSTGNGASERPLRWPFGVLFHERLRLGIPGLFHFLKAHDYDIWLYTTQYYSPDYWRLLFRLYGVRIDGVETGTARKRKFDIATRNRLDQMIARQYPITIHVDNCEAVRIDSQTKAFEEFQLTGNDRAWSQEVMDIVSRIEKKDL